MDEAKKKRTVAKGNHTRAMTTVYKALTAGTPVTELKASTQKWHEAYEKLKTFHEEYLMTLEEKEIELEDEWFNEIAEKFDFLTTRLNNYNQQEGKTEILQELETKEIPETNKEIKPHSINLRTERTALPKFTGKIADFYDFRRDFQFLVGRKYQPEEALYVLRSCLHSSALDWVKGEQNYEEAWKTLDGVFGNPRLTSDAMLGTLNDVKPIAENDSNKFIELHHLVKRTFQTLSQLQRPSDIDNTTTLGVIEKKLNITDRLKWATYQLEKKILPSIDTFLSWMEGEIWVRNIAGANIRSTGGSAVNRKNYHANTVDGQITTNKTNTFIRKCWVCEGNHKVELCTTFENKTLADRLAAVRNNKACYFCLNKHRDRCQRRKKCIKITDGSPCTFHHHPMLHGAPFQTSGSNQSNLCQSNSNVHAPNESLLPIISVTAINPGTQVQRPANILFDSGSQITIIRHDFAKELGLFGEDIDMEITKVGGQKIELETQVYHLAVKAKEEQSAGYTIKAVGMHYISNGFNPNHEQWGTEHFDLKPNQFHQGRGPVDILLGIDHIEFHGGQTIVKGQFALKETILGPVIFGANKPQDKQLQTYMVTMDEQRSDLPSFWTTEEMGVALNPCCKEHTTGIKKNLTATEHKEAKMIRESAIKEGNQWLIPLPWKKDPKELPNNYKQVLAKLESTEKRLEKIPKYAAIYDSQVKALVEQGSARKLTQEEIEHHTGPVHYISHHAVYRPEKKSTPCRLVFNAAAKFKGHVLNEYLCKGPDLLNDLIGVLIRFRENSVAIMGDVSKMYHQVLVDPVLDAHTHRFLWRNFEKERPPDIYIKLVLTFGDISSPALANTAIDLTAEEGKIKYPEAADTVINCRYMDDICESLPTIAEARKRCSEVDEVLNQGHFKIKEWVSNERLFPQTDKTEIANQTELPMSEKVLGIIWDKEGDKLSVRTVQHDSDFGPYTKRAVLSIMAGIYDVFGFVAPIIVTAKIMMQQLWRLKLDWDEELPENIREQWKTWLKELQNIKTIQFPRSLTPPLARGNPDLVIFCDASQKAFGAVAYLRWEIDDPSTKEFETRYIMAKSRVAPLKELTIPRLELQAAVIASRLCETIQRETRLACQQIYLFTDSQIVLAWLNDKSQQYKTFVSTRVGEIQSKTEVDNWYYCPSELNPADDLSRGRTVSELTEKWKKGPKFLTKPKIEWNFTPQKEKIDSTDVSMELKKSVTLAAMTVNVNDHILDSLKNQSSHWRVVRITATILRFVNNFKAKWGPPNITFKQTGILTTEELIQAETILVKQAQKSFQTTAEFKKSKTLTPFVDKDGIVRVGGRVEKAVISYDNRHPAILPYNHWLSKLVVMRQHQYGHPGVATTSAKVRRRFWIIGVSRIAKSIINKCIYCKETRAKVESPYMADLPQVRVQPSPPFYNIALDLFGPFHIKFGRNKTKKYWGILFTCLNTRAVYVDVTVDYSTMECLQTLRRFFSIRGYPNTIISDQGTQLVGASKELQNWCNNRGIKWKFVTPTAAHQNGCAESLIRSVKNALKHAIGEQTLTCLELQTVVFEAANLVNERPIGLLSNDPNDGPYLCPNDILLGRASSSIPHGPFPETNNPRHRVEFCQKIIDSFWHRWYRDVFPTLVPRRKWNVQKRNVQVNDYVLVAEPNPFRGKWTKGLIVKVFPGDDGKVRNVRVKTLVGEYERPITKIVVLLPAEGHSE